MSAFNPSLTMMPLIPKSVPVATKTAAHAERMSTLCLTTKCHAFAQGAIFFW